MNFIKKLYVDSEIQFPIIVLLILLVSFEGVFVGWGFYKVIAATKQWHLPNQTLNFFIILGMTIIPTVIFNFIIGTYLSFKLVGPLVKIRQVISEVTRGNLEGKVSLEDEDLLKSYALDINKMNDTLRNFIYKDKQYISEVTSSLNACQKILADKNNFGPEEQEEVEKLIKQSKSRLSIINMHFVKGKII